MIDYDDDIINAVETALAVEYPDMPLYDEALPADAEFPCVCIEEIDNYTYQRTIDSASNENHAAVAYEINVYSNRSQGKRSECRSIFAFVSDIFTGLGFTRLSKNPVPFADATKYRLVGRFAAVVAANGDIYRR